MKQAKCRVGIVGGGRMGCGIAYMLSRAGHVTWISDPQPESLDSVPKKFGELAALLGDEDHPPALPTLKADLLDLAPNVDFVIEAAPEVLELKRHIFSALEKHAPSHTILASNTSAIPIREIASGMYDKARVIGTHFWNPPALVTLVEVVQSHEASGPYIETAMDVLNGAGWTAVHLKKDIPGFVGNRMQHALKREAIALVAAGVCDAETVDTVVKKGFGARLGVIGPLEQSDMLGLELTRNIHDVLLPDLDVSDHVQPYLADLIAAGKTGMAVGEGFRKWTAAEAEEVKNRLNTFMAAQAASAKQPRE